MSSATQKRFDEKYISSKEIIERLKITRPTVALARTTGRLPDPVAVNNALIFLWERELIEPHIAAWELELNARRAGKTS